MADIIPIGQAPTSNSHPLGSLGDFLTGIGNHISNYERIASIVATVFGPELSIFPDFLDTAFKGLGSYLNLIEDHKLDFLLPVTPFQGEELPASPIGGRGPGAIPSGVGRIGFTPSPRTSAGFVQISADAPVGSVQLASR